MFNSDFSITGKHANYLKDLCELRGNVPDKDQHNNFKIFNAYVDAYIVCPIIGYQYSRKCFMGSAAEGDAGILTEAIVKRENELKYVYQILMLVDEDSEPDADRRISRAFNLSETTADDQAMVAENMKIYNEYFLGGLEILHEQFVDSCSDRDSCMLKMYEFVKKFNEEHDGEALKASISNFLNK